MALARTVTNPQSGIVTGYHRIGGVSRISYDSDPATTEVTLVSYINQDWRMQPDKATGAVKYASEQQIVLQGVPPDGASVQGVRDWAYDAIKAQLVDWAGATSV